MKKSNEEPLVSVIIVNYDGRKFLEECLPSLMKVDYDNIEIILVDNNSTDDSIEFVKRTFPKIIIIKLDGNYGFAEPNNIGAKNARGDFLLFLNNDTMVEQSFITEMINVVKKDSKIAICQSLLLKPDGKVDSSGDFVDTLGRAYSLKDRPYNIRRILSARGASMLIRKKIFNELGGFDKNFFASFEDVDLGWRAWLAGYIVILVPTSIVYHKSGKTIQKLTSEVQFHGVKNTITLRFTNFELSRAITSSFMTFFIVALKKIFGITVKPHQGNFNPLPSTKNMIKGITWFLANLGYVSEKRKIVNSKRVKTTEDLIKLGLITPT